ncbi:MAG: ABC transporter ATP-binding protein/permease [Candidatus Omnitrophica bacterium]|nr:ABC transporter ATP-binding protein/permease [Candidatus Omnitrophota bacterium]MBU1995863.1 ABC transporter ATP-binding protein/permease [Candidatus Omnitrophota bacterium]MBU4334691.1 ABC transporter ATP-binding protein/permease [Candidatus Omnitrophota bacterium]
MDKTLKFIKIIAQRFPMLFLWNVLFFIFAGLIEVAAITSFAPIFDFLLNNRGMGEVSRISSYYEKGLIFLNIPYNLTSIVCVFFLLTLLSGIMSVVIRYLIAKTQLIVLKDIIIGTFSDMLKAKWAFFTAESQGVLFNSFMREAKVVGEAFSAMSNMVSGIVQCLIVLVVPFFISWQITLACVLGAGMLSFLFSKAGKLSYKLGRENIQTGNELSKILSECLSSVKIILGYGNSEYVENKMTKAWELNQKYMIKSQVLIFAIPQIYRPTAILILILAFVLSQKLGFHFSETAAIVYAFYRIIPKVSELMGKKVYLDNFYPSFEQINRIRDRAKALKQPTGNKEFCGFDKEISFNNVSFAYTDSNYILREISFKIKRGTMSAFVGGSGAGKSTLIDMLMGFHEPQKGSITIDNNFLFDYDIVSYRTRIGYVPQHISLFDDTIRNNLIWGSKNVTKEEIENACRLSYVDEFIKVLPDGLETVIGDKGVRLSGGQQQRLSLARAILRKPDILILDEATSALDTSSERYIQLAIENMSTVTTIVVIAHRLSTIINADAIYVLKEGMIIEQGNSIDLMKNNSEFSKMVQAQQMENC